jgi:hypothetical protein
VEEFHGYALVVQFDRRAMNQSPWVSVQCQDSMWRFDARIVTYQFPAQSVTRSILDLVDLFCNDVEAPRPDNFGTAYVRPDMPALPSIAVVNERPSTVMRRLLAAVQGGFYIAGNEVHAWAGSTSEPDQTNPVPLTNDLPSLKSFQLTHDATQIRKRVLVEGRRASTLIPYPAVPKASGQSQFLGVPVTDATIFSPATGPDAFYLARVGSQWVIVRDPIVVTPLGANPPQTRTQQAFTPGQMTIALEPLAVMPPPRGWIRIAGQFSRYASISGNPIAEAFLLHLPASSNPYGVFTVAIPAGEAVYWVDAVMSLEGHGVSWAGGSTVGHGADMDLRAEPSDSPVVTLAQASRPREGWPALEGFVQDGRYSYEGALGRAEDDLSAFAAPLVSAAWETEDPNARPGRVQEIALTGTSVIDPVNLSLTITRVDLSFPLKTQLPRRKCSASAIKPSTFLDLVLTDQS